ncbi:MAG: hypothetical protein DCF25_18795 [Leptolyngbya foveolarum]|uniref:Uncharacterized protein n=1 Tax=Leptolyngbya foveolarum TaxID=47253 RepID=A0A2W4TYB2_9CYAN|nr:MAG: hypothetical protein DCF25_18795 [Leptolyngbya foveolarum]
MSQLPVVNSLQMSLGDSLIDIRKPKPPLKKAITFVSPLLLVSIGLHGLAMLLPIPEQEKVETEVVELPEPIQVSELPELDVQAPESQPVPVFAPAPVPEAPAVVQPSEPAQSPTVVIQQPNPVEPSEPQLMESQEIASKPSEKKPVAEKNPIEPESHDASGSGSKVRVYRKENTTSLSYLEAFATALEQGVFSDGTPIQYSSIRKGRLTFALLAGDNCFREASPIDADSVRGR